MTQSDNLNSTISNRLNQQLFSLPGISLQEMDRVKLMNRRDEKFVVALADLIPIIDHLSSTYKVTEIEGERILDYKNLYLDSSQLDFYKAHHQGKDNRYKVRIRNYISSNLYFLEVKHRRKGRTDKKRIAIQDFKHIFTNQDKGFEFIDRNYPISAAEIFGVLWNDYQRITLVNTQFPERVTIDINLQFKKGELSYQLDDVAIIEVKQENLNRETPIRKLLKENGIRPLRLSKYCFGQIMLTPDLKANRFKTKLLQLRKIKPIFA